jgi:hypothetical protein
MKIQVLSLIGSPSPLKYDHNTAEVQYYNQNESLIQRMVSLLN